SVTKAGVIYFTFQQTYFKNKIKTNKPPTFVNASIPAAQPAFEQAAPAALAPAPAPVAQPAAQAAALAAEDTSKYITIKSPMIGTFYRSSSPDKPMFVNVGDEIKVGQVLCIIEAMKLFNEIESEVSGRVVKILVDNASPVEYDQPLFLVEPM
ncbi:MAG: acetyl-CoA carboxylase biotin carboxyl carrier protein, partial [Mucilaginibacter sp.]